MHVVAKNKLLNVHQCKLWTFGINSSKYPLQHTWSRRTLPVDRQPPAAPCGSRCCSGPTASRSCLPWPDLRDLASWSGPDEVNVTDNITAMSKCVTNSNTITTDVCMLLLRQGSDSSAGSWSQDWKRWSQHRCPRPPSRDSCGAWEEQDWWRIARGHVEQKTMKHPGAVWLLWCLAVDDEDLDPGQAIVGEVSGYPQATGLERHEGPRACLCARKNATRIETVKWKKCTWHWAMNNVSQDTVCHLLLPLFQHGAHTRSRPCAPPEKNVKTAPNKTYKLTNIIATMLQQHRQPCLLAPRTGG